MIRLLIITILNDNIFKKSLLTNQLKIKKVKKKVVYIYLNLNSKDTFFHLFSQLRKFKNHEDIELKYEMRKRIL